MNQKTTLCMMLSLLSASFAGCGDPSSPSSAPVQPNQSVMASASLSGRIVYTLSGQLRIYNVATKTDVSIGISGVNPKFSPDGAMITYQSGGIRVVNSDGTSSRLLNATGGVPSFDPTGTMIAYNDNGIWKINVDGTGRTQLTNDDGHWAAWSPDGTQLAYGGPVGNVQQLFIVNADGSNRHQALTSGAVIDVVWRPSSRILLGISNGNYDLYSYDPAIPSNLSRLTTSKSADFEPSWSFDGTQISWTSGASGRTGGIWIMNADGTGKQGPVIPKGRQGSWGF